MQVLKELLAKGKDGVKEEFVELTKAEQIALSIDRAALKGSGYSEPVLLKSHKGAKAIGKAEKITIRGSKVVAKVRTR